MKRVLFFHSLLDVVKLALLLFNYKRKQGEGAKGKGVAALLIAYWSESGATLSYFRASVSLGPKNFFVY